jgi:hypothetical protein
MQHPKVKIVTDHKQDDNFACGSVWVCFLYSLYVAVIAANAAGIVCLGYWTSGILKTVGYKPRKDVVLTSIIIVS